MKNLKKMLLGCMLVMVALIFNTRVSASIKGNLIMEYVPGYYYVMSSSNFYMSYEIPFYSINDYIVYCIEPGANINTWSYIGEDGFVNSPYSDDINSKLELIGYYGYGYYGHDTLEYRISTQALIWELTSSNKVEFWTRQYGYGNIIDVSKEKEEIMSLVNKHYIKPSFDETVINCEYGNEIVLKDENNVLANYEIYSDGNNEINKVGNLLYIKPLVLGNSKIELKRKKYKEDTTVFFIGQDKESQRLAKFSFSDEVVSLVNLETIGAKIKIVKVDSETKEVIKNKNIEFKIKDLDKDEYVCVDNNCVFKTSSDGVAIIPIILAGKFRIEEAEEQDLGGYLWNDKGVEINIDNHSNITDNVYEVMFENIRVKGSIEINKKGEKLNLDNNSYNYEEILLEGVIYGLYANEDIYIMDKLKYKKDELIGNLITDELGYAKLDDLELGKYYIKEISSNFGNMVDSTKYMFEIKYRDKYTDVVNIILNFNNYLPKGTLRFLKTDLYSKEPISNTLIEVYSCDNEQIVYTGYTDLNGMIVIDNLPLGKYYLKEIKSAVGYKNTNEIVDFEISKNNDVIKIMLDNEFIVNVPNTMVNDINIFLIIGILFMFNGLGWYLYARKK